MSTAAQKARQERAQARLQEQLDSGFRNDKKGKKVKLTDKDIKRIQGEINNSKKK